jgi:uncharacterized membrane protein YbhN (UPF0104 family)|tara:strand:+ start:237 stop:1112 length:876 start_codon:yes stop_codon:yes gene_type:complete
MKIVITILLVFLIFLKVDVNKVVGSLLNIELRYLVTAFVLAMMVVALRIYRWYYLIKKDTNVSFRTAFVSYLAGLTTAIITPLRIGELTRVLYIKNQSKVKLVKFVLIDKFFDLFVIFILFVLGLSYIDLRFLLLAMVLSVVLVLFFRNIRKMNFPFKAKVLELVDGFRLVNRKTVFNCLLLTLASFIIYIMQFYVLVLSFEDVSFIAVFFVVPIIVLSNILPITIGGIGVREWVSIFVFSFFGVSEIAALSSAFLAFVLTLLIPSILGLFFVNRVKINNTRKLAVGEESG